MGPRFIYNPKTDCLHIEGYCCHTKKGFPFDALIFSSEDEALGHDGRALGMCKLCQRKREKELVK